MKSFFNKIFRGKKRAFALAMFLFLAAAIPVTGYFVMYGANFDERGMAMLGGPGGSLYSTPTSGVTSSPSGGSISHPSNRGAPGTVTGPSPSTSSAGGGGGDARGSSPSPALEAPSSSSRSDSSSSSSSPGPAHPYSQPITPGATGSSSSSSTSSPSSTLSSGGTSATTSRPTISGTGTNNSYWSVNYQRWTGSTPSVTSSGGGSSPTSTSGVSPECGSHHDQLFGIEESDWSSGSFCTVGSPDPSSPIFPGQGNTTTWKCIEGSNSVSCVAGKEFAETCEKDSDCGKSELCFTQANACLKGDVLGDGKIGMGDFRGFRDDFTEYKKNGWSDSLQRSDFNNDKRISMADFSIFTSSYALFNSVD